MLRFSGGVGRRSQSAHCVGFRVAALIALMSAVAAITSANCRYICPVSPGRKAAGMKTDISTSVMPMTGPSSWSIALDGSVVRREPAFDMRGRALDDHDRVVDHDADREDDREQGGEVDREAERVHRREGADDRHRHRRRRHEHRPPVLQEHQDHDEHQQGGFDQRAIDLVDRRLHEARGVERHAIGQARRKIGLELLHLRPHFLRDRERVRIRRLVDRDAAGGRAVQREGLRVGLRAEFDAGHVAQRG